MRDELFEDLLESVRQMSAIERGRSKPARKYSAEDIIGPERAALLRARKKADLPQDEFAAVIGVPVGTLRGWEQGRRKPTGPARVLIEVAASHPDVVRKAAKAVQQYSTGAPLMAGRASKRAGRPTVKVVADRDEKRGPKRKP